MAKKETNEAKKIYATMVKAFKNEHWKFQEQEDDLTIFTDFVGEDLRMTIAICIDSDVEVIRFYSPMPFTIEEDKRVDLAIAVCAANDGLINGSFDYNIETGEISFGLKANYHDCKIGPDFFVKMIQFITMVTDLYNDQFLLLSAGKITVKEFIEKFKH